MSFFEFPHTRTYDSDLGWLIWAMRKLISDMTEFTEINSIKFGDPINWNIATQYEPTTIVVDDEGNGYISRKAVPAGIALTDTEYWTRIFAFSDLTDAIRESIAHNNGRKNTADIAFYKNDLVWWKDRIYKVLYDIAAGTEFIIGTNVELYTVNDRLQELSGEIINYGDDISALQTFTSEFAENIKKAITAPDMGDSDTATIALQKGDLLFWKNILYKATQDIAVGAHLIILGNIEETDIETELKNLSANIGDIIDVDIAQLQGDIAAERAAREAADEALTDDLAAEAAARIAAVTAERDARVAADQGLDDKIEALRYKDYGIRKLLYVSVQGDDNNDGFTPTTPKRTLMAAYKWFFDNGYNDLNIALVHPGDYELTDNRYTNIVLHLYMYPEVSPASGQFKITFRTENSAQPYFYNSYVHLSGISDNFDTTIFNFPEGLHADASSFYISNCYFYCIKNFDIRVGSSAHIVNCKFPQGIIIAPRMSSVTIEGDNCQVNWNGNPNYIRGPFIRAQNSRIAWYGTPYMWVPPRDTQPETPLISLQSSIMDVGCNFGTIGNTGINNGFKVYPIRGRSSVIFMADTIYNQLLNSTVNGSVAPGSESYRCVRIKSGSGFASI